jgi:hypothetical protein
MLLGVNEDVFEALDSEVGCFLNIVNVYGAPQARDKENYVWLWLYRKQKNKFVGKIDEIDKE